MDFQFETVILSISSLSGCWGIYVPVSMDELLHPLGLCELATLGKCPETAPPIHLSSSTMVKSCALGYFVYQNNIQP